MDNRAIIITGANGNLGSAIAESLINTGENLVLLYHKNLERLNHLIAKHPKRIAAIKCDIRDYETLKPAIFNTLTGKGWVPSALVHTAAMRSIDHTTLAESDPVVWKEVIETNILGTYNVLKAIIHTFQETKEETAFRNFTVKDPYRRIVLLGSDVSRIGLPYGTAYGASKAAIANITRSLGIELGKESILINTVSPGPINIDNSHFPEEYREFRVKYYQQILAQIPLKRFAELEDIVSFIHYLISDENKYITGEEFFLTGGKI